VQPVPDKLKIAGTPDQTEVVDDYPTHDVADKLRIPYIERYNGNICVKNQEFERAIGHYNKTLLSMKMLFQGNAGTGEQYITDD
jgi:hypothetical protein